MLQGLGCASQPDYLKPITLDPDYLDPDYLEMAPVLT